MLQRIQEKKALLDGLETGESEVIINEFGVPQIVFKQPATQPINQNNPSEFTNHSGGAKGADYFGWDQIGQEFGLTNHKHYYTGDRNDNNAPYGNTEITTEDYEEGRYKVAQAAKRNYGYEYKTMKDSRLIRNWAQVKYSDAIFAIGTIVQTGEKLFPNKPGDTRVATAPSVTGGTGYAVGMAINEGKPVHVFDQSKKSWFVWDGKQFV